MEQKLWDILPTMYEYKIKQFQLENKNNFDCVFKINIFNESDVKKWLKEFEQRSYTNFRVARTAPGKQTRVIFKKYYRCHHNTRASETASKTRKAHVKHTGCEATLLITVNNSDMKKCKEPDVKNYPCTVKYHNFHNHPLISDELLCHRKPSDRVEQKIRDLLLKNHTPVSALKILKQDLQQEFKEDYAKIIKDGAFCPKLQWVYHKYYMIFKEIYSSSDKAAEMMIKCEQQSPDQVYMDFDVSSCANSLDDSVFHEEYITSSEDPMQIATETVTSESICDSVFSSELCKEELSFVENDLSDGEYSNLGGGISAEIPVAEDYVGDDDEEYVCTVQLKDDFTDKHLITFINDEECTEEQIIEISNYDGDLGDVFDTCDKEVFL